MHRVLVVCTNNRKRRKIHIHLQQAHQNLCFTICDFPSPAFKAPALPTHACMHELMLVVGQHTLSKDSRLQHLAGSAAAAKARVWQGARLKQVAVHGCAAHKVEHVFVHRIAARRVIHVQVLQRRLRALRANPKGFSIEQSPDLCQPVKRQSLQQLWSSAARSACSSMSKASMSKGPASTSLSADADWSSRTLSCTEGNYHKDLGKEFHGIVLHRAASSDGCIT